MTCNFPTDHGPCGDHATHQSRSGVWLLCADHAEAAKYNGQRGIRRIK